MNRLETTELEYVTVLADELSFTAAAARLGTTQPALSRAIGRVERRLGVSLFVRTTRSVCLSDAGETFVAGARQVLSDLDAVVHATRAQVRNRPLVVTLRPGAGSGLLARGLEAWHDATVRVEPGDDPVRAVRSGIADLAIACSTDDLDGLRSEEIGAEPTVVLVPRGHPLTRLRRVTLARVAASVGFQAHCPAVPLAEIVDRVALTGLVVLAAADVAQRIGPDVRALPVLDAPSTTLCAARLAGRGHPVAPAFLRHLRNVRTGPATVRPVRADGVTRAVRRTAAGR